MKKIWALEPILQTVDKLGKSSLPTVFFVFIIEVLNLEVKTMLTKHNSIQRDQIEMIALEQLVPTNHLVRKIESAIFLFYL